MNVLARLGGLSLVGLCLAPLALGAQDSALIREFGGLLESAPIERLEGAAAATRVTGVLLADVDGDGRDEALVSLRPGLRQTPTLLVFRRNTAGEWKRIIEGLAPGRLRPVSRGLGDTHAYKVGMDLTAGDGSAESVQRVLDAGPANNMSMVAYRGWFHGDVRVGSTSVIDLTEWPLPVGTDNTCEHFEFSLPEHVVVGTVEGAGTEPHLVALTNQDITIYRINAITPSGRLTKQSWMMPRPAGTTSVRRTSDGAVQLALADRVVPLRLPSRERRDTSLAIGERVAARVDSAFGALATLALRDSAKFSWLLELSRFKATNVGWAAENEGTMRAVSVGVQRPAWLVVVPASDPAYARMGSVMESDRGASVPATRIKADTIAAAWSAIFVSYELSHLRDEVLSLLPENPKPILLAASSRRAYRAEYQAALAIGGRPLEQHLDSVITTAKPPSARALAEGIIPLLRASFGQFDSLITNQKALTEREEQRRAGVYAAALILRYAEARNLSDEEFAQALRCFGGCR